MFESIKKMFGLGKFSKKNKLVDDTNHDISKVIGDQEGFIEDMSFDFVHKEFIRLMKLGQINRALSLLIVMSKKAKTKEEHKTFMMHITSGVLNGVFWKDINADMKDWIFSICRTLGCLIGLWIKDLHGQKKAQNLLKIFNKYLNKKDENKEMTEQQKIELFSAWLSDFEGIMTLSKDDSLLSNEERTLLMEYTVLATENTTKLKSSVFSKSPSVIEALLKDKNESKIFWSEVVQEIPKGKCGYDKVNFYVQKFISWFGEKMMNEMMDWIKTEKIIWKIHITNEAEDAVNAFRKLFIENLDDVEKILDKSEKTSPALAA
jgi:hypothetical protein